MNADMCILKTLIVDDEPLAHNIIKEYASEVAYIDIVGQAHRPTAALEILKSEEIDLLFLDIQMPKMSGLDLLRIVNNPPITIITSAYSEYGVESYELDICDYLLKPFRLDRFLQATEKARDHFMKKQKSIKDSTDHYLVLKSDKKLIRQEVNAIYYLESYGNYVKVHTEGQTYLTPKTLSSLLNELDDMGFCQVHKSYVINLSTIEYLEGNMAVLKNGKKVTISKNFKRSIFNKL